MAQHAPGAVDICYEVTGDAGSPAVILVSGLGGQLVSWEEGFWRSIEAAGFRVVRFDNRDAGLSGPPGETEAPGASDLPYTLDDMAGDVARLMDWLEIDSAHLLGVSMGGMIVQLVAIHYPDRVRSLTSIMSTTGAHGVGMPTAEALSVLARRPPTSREEYIAAELENHRVIGSPGYPVEDAWRAARAAREYDRSFRPRGVARQLGAILAAGDRTEALTRIRVPTLVIHGEADPLIAPDGGQATAAAIEGSRLVTIPGMGHEITPPLRGLLMDPLVEHLREAQSAWRAPGDARDRGQGR